MYARKTENKAEPVTSVSAAAPSYTPQENDIFHTADKKNYLASDGTTPCTGCTCRSATVRPPRSAWSSWDSQAGQKIPIFLRTTAAAALAVPTICTMPASNGAGCSATQRFEKGHLEAPGYPRLLSVPDCEGVTLEL